MGDDGPARAGPGALQPLEIASVRRSQRLLLIEDPVVG
jgi:hypothetical protein